MITELARITEIAREKVALQEPKTVDKFNQFLSIWVEEGNNRLLTRPTTLDW